MDLNDYANSPVYRTANEASFFIWTHLWVFWSKKDVLLERIEKV